MTETYEVTDTFDEPFYGGEGTKEDDYGLPISIDGRSFIIDTTSQEFRRKSIKLLNTQQAQTGQDYAIEPPTVWRRSTESWHSGSDQQRFDRPDSIDSRYHDSKGIDPWTKYGFELLHDVDQLMTTAPGSGPIHLASVLDALMVANGTTASYFATVSTAPVVHTLPGKALACVSDGESYYVLCDNGVIQKRDAAGAWTTWQTVTPFDPAKSMMSYVKGYLLVGSGPHLWDATAPNTLIPVGPAGGSPLSGWWWRDAAGGLSVIYVLGGMGDRWHVHSVNIVGSGPGTAASLDAPVVAATLPDGEVAYALATYLSYVLIGTNVGWRFAMPGAGGELTYGQSVETPGPVQCFEGQGRFVWYGISQGDLAGLGRADLSTFVSPMTPASAPDLESQFVGDVRSVCSLGGVYDGLGKRVFSVDNEGVFIEADRLVPSGWLTTGVVTFNSTDDKMGLYGQVFHEALRGSVLVEIASDAALGGWERIGFNDVPDTVSVGNMPYNEAFSSLETRITLTRDDVDDTLGPRVTRNEFRAIDIPGRATEWSIPLLLHEQITWGNSVQDRDVWSDYDFLVALIRSRRQFLYREANRTWSLHGVDFVWAPEHLTSDRSMFNGTFLLIAREIT